MSGRLAYITSNGALSAFDAESQRQDREAKARQEREVDAALRRGLAGVVAGGGGAPASVPAAPAPAPQRPAGAVMASTGGVAEPVDDDDAAVRTIIGEAANQGERGMAGVAHVIQNRARQSGMTPRQVVLAPSQFEPWQTRRAELMAIGRDSPQYQEALRIWRAAQAGQIPDPTGGADHFLNPEVVRQRRGGSLPSWAQGQGTQIGAHTFYRAGYRGTPRPAGAAPTATQAQASAASAPAAGGGWVNPMAPAARELLRVPGGGRSALSLIQSGEQMAARRDAAAARTATREAAASRGQASLDQRARRESERNMMLALGRGDVELARTFADRAGIRLPEQVWQDRAIHSRFAAGTLLARRYYRDPQQATAFVREYMTSGNAMAAAERAGAPRGGDANWRPIWVQEGERQVLELLNTRSGETRRAANADGQPLVRPPAAGRGGANADRRAALMRIYGDEAMVDRLMTGVAPTPRQINQAYQGFQRTYANDPSLIGNEAEVRRRAEADMDRLFPDWRRIRDGAALPRPAETPAPTEPPPAPAPAAPPAPQAAPGGLPRVTTRAEWEALPPGARYIDPQGNTRTKAPRA